MWEILDDLDARQRGWIAEWHQSGMGHAGDIIHPRDPLEAMCFFNYRLWHAEDAIRYHGNDCRTVCEIKKQIDALNQHRNDAIEAIDEWILARRKYSTSGGLNSETPGSLADRLFINGLKIYHMNEIMVSRTPPAEECRAYAGKLAVLGEQRSDLLGCLARLHDDCETGRRHFKVYRQMKMYNDPRMRENIT